MRDLIQPISDEDFFNQVYDFLTSYTNKNVHFVTLWSNQNRTLEFRYIVKMLIRLEQDGLILKQHIWGNYYLDEPDHEKYIFTSELLDMVDGATDKNSFVDSYKARTKFRQNELEEIRKRQKRARSLLILRKFFKQPIGIGKMLIVLMLGVLLGALIYASGWPIEIFEMIGDFLCLRLYVCLDLSDL